MDSLPRKLLSDAFNYTNSCITKCIPAPDCDSNCFDVCVFRCPPILSPPFPYYSSPHHVFPKRFLVVTLVLGITMICLFCLTIYYKFYSGPCIRSRRRTTTDPATQIREEFLDEDHGPVLDHPIWYIHTVGLQPSVINSISVFKFKKGEGLVEGTDCSVCLSEFEEDETLRLLPKCNHAFHIPCIDTWLRSHTNCPMCRAPVVVVVSSPVPEGSGSEGGVEETPIGVSETESGDSELRIVIEEGDGGGDDDDEQDRRKGIEEEEKEEGIQPLRRSISLDSLSALKIHQALAGVSDTNSVVKLENDESSIEIAPKSQSFIKFRASSSIGRSLQIGPSSLKRSLSCGGKLFLQRYTKNSTTSVLPL